MRCDPTSMEPLDTIRTPDPVPLTTTHDVPLTLSAMSAAVITAAGVVLCAMFTFSSALRIAAVLVECTDALEATSRSKLADGPLTSISDVT